MFLPLSPKLEPLGAPKAMAHKPRTRTQVHAAMQQYWEAQLISEVLFADILDSVFIRRMSQNDGTYIDVYIYILCILFDIILYNIIKYHLRSIIYIYDYICVCDMT